MFSEPAADVVVLFPACVASPSQGQTVPELTPLLSLIIRTRPFDHVSHSLCPNITPTGQSRWTRIRHPSQLSPFSIPHMRKHTFIYKVFSSLFQMTSKNCMDCRSSSCRYNGISRIIVASLSSSLVIQTTDSAFRRPALSVRRDTVPTRSIGTEPQGRMGGKGGGLRREDETRKRRTTNTLHTTPTSHPSVRHILYLQYEQSLHLYCPCAIRTEVDDVRGEEQKRLKLNLLRGPSFQ